MTGNEMSRFKGLISIEILVVYIAAGMGLVNLSARSFLKLISFVYFLRLVSLSFPPRMNVSTKRKWLLFSCIL